MPATTARRRSLPDARVAPWLIGLIGAALALGRIPMATWDILYAEDGAVFMYEADRLDEFILFRPYAGYQHLIPRLVIWAVHSFVPVQDWALAVTITTCVLIGAVCAVVYLCARHLVDSAIMAWLIGLVPAANAASAGEALGNLANFHSWCLVALAAMLALPPTRSVARHVTEAIVVTLAALTEVQAILLAPFVLVLALRTKFGRLGYLIGYVIGCTGQGLTVLLAPRGTTGLSLDWVDATRGFLVSDVFGMVTTNAHFIWLIVQTVSWLGLVIATGVLMLAIGISCLLQRSEPLEIRFWPVMAIVLAVATWSLSYVVNPGVRFEGEGLQAIRWGVSGSMLLSIAILITIGRLQQRWANITCAVIMAALIALHVPGALPYRAQSIPWRQAVAAAVAECRTGVTDAELPVAPANFMLRVKCTRLLHDAG